MSRRLPVLILLAAGAYAGIYNNYDGWTISGTALLSAPDMNADTLAVFSPGTAVTMFGRPARNNSTTEWCKVSSSSHPEIVGFVRIIDLALTSTFDQASQTVLMYGFSDSDQWTEERSTLRLTRNGRILHSNIFSINTISAPGDWNFHYRGCFFQRDESGFENASAVFILHFPARNSDLRFEKILLVVTEDSTIVTGLSISEGLIEEYFDAVSYYVTPEENSADNILNTVAFVSEKHVEEGEQSRSLFQINRSVWTGHQFETEEEHCSLILTEDSVSYLTRAELQPYRIQYDFRAGGYQILGYPENLLPPGAEALEIIPVSFSTESTDFTRIIIAFTYPQGWFPLDTLLSPGDVNTAKLFGRWMEETRTLNLYPYGAMSSSYPISTWRRDNEWKFELISTETHDAATVAYAAMDSLLTEEDIEGASGWLNYILMSKMSHRTHAEMAVQFFYGAVNACMHSNNGMQPLEEANMALSLMNMRNWFINVPSMGEEAFLNSEFAPYINTGNLQEGLGYLSRMAESRGDSLYASELANAANSLNPLRN